MIRRYTSVFPLPVTPKSRNSFFPSSESTVSTAVCCSVLRSISSFGTAGISSSAGSFFWSSSAENFTDRIFTRPFFARVSMGDLLIDSSCMRSASVISSTSSSHSSARICWIDPTASFSSASLAFSGDSRDTTSCDLPERFVTSAGTIWCIADPYVHEYRFTTKRRRSSCS